MLLKNHTTATRIKQLLFILIGLLAAHNGYAQPKVYRLGIVANLPVINAYKDTFDTRTGWGVWGSAEYNVNKNLRFTPTIAYNNFGYSQNYFNDSNLIQRRLIAEHYFDAMAVLNFLPTPAQNSTRLSIGVGLSVLASRVTDQPDVLNINASQITFDNKKAFTPNVLLSAGISAPITKKFDFGINYLHSLPNKIYPRDISGRLGTFQISLNYKFYKDDTPPIKKETSTAYSQQQLSLYTKDSLVLIVRLKENIRRIAQLEGQGYYLDAIDEKEKTLENNKEIVQNFNEKFTLLPVYYFYDTDSKTALEKGYEGILLNDKLERDSTIKLPQKEILIAEFARQFFESTQTSGMYGLVVYNNKFKTLPEPFPSFVSNAYGFLKTKEVISKFQKKLVSYLAQ